MSKLRYSMDMLGLVDEHGNLVWPDYLRRITGIKPDTATSRGMIEPRKPRSRKTPDAK